VTNILGPFLGAYPATGSFSRTAIKSKAGVRTPLAGVITAIVVLLAIYALPALFYWIPNASLSGVIIHAVGDLITPPKTLYQFWCVSPFEVLIFFVGVIVTVFSSIENGIYCTISLSAAVLLFRVLKAKGRFLGQVRVHSVLDDQVIGNNTKPDADGEIVIPNAIGSPILNRNIFIPIDHGDGSNPSIEVKNPYDGIFIYRFSEGFNYPNANHYLDQLTNHIFAHTRLTNPNSYPRPGDRPWNDPGPRRGRVAETHDDRPTLKAIILDFSSVNNVDVTSVQQLIDVRNQLDRYAAPDTVDWHFACINNRWTKRALASAGFGYISEGSELQQRWKAIFSVAEIGGSDSAASAAEASANEKVRHKNPKINPAGDAIRSDESGGSLDGDLKKDTGIDIKHPRKAIVNSVNRPLFHIDLTIALQSAIANVEARNAFDVKGGAGVGQLP
jgi:solute carrier family 26 (sodium-independent sulfate anion transporter), member 11